MTEPAAITTVSIENAAEQLKAKIRSAFVELIPPEQWTAMIVEELKRFTESTPATHDRWNNVATSARPSLFSEICREQYSAVLREKVVEVLQSPEFSAQVWNGEVSKVIKEWLTENSEKLIQSTILALAGHAAQNLIATMPHYRP